MVIEDEFNVVKQMVNTTIIANEMTKKNKKHIKKKQENQVVSLC